MRLKYYLKGLGIGMIVAALLMGIATKDSATMTDEEIKIRAKELGMVEQKTLADTIKPTEEPLETMVPGKSSEEKQEIVNTEAPDEEPVNTEAPAKETELPVEEEPAITEAPLITEAPVVEPMDKEEPIATNEIIRFEIQKGQSSDSVSNKLEEMGLVSDAISYNKYLCNNGYDRKLNVGTYELQIGMTEEEIAKIITRTR